MAVRKILAIFPVKFTLLFGEWQLLVGEGGDVPVWVSRENFSSPAQNGHLRQRLWQMVVAWLTVLQGVTLSDQP